MPVPRILEYLKVHYQHGESYTFLVVKVDYICHGFRGSNIEKLQLICY